MARNFAERLVASVIWSREDPRFPGHRQHGQPTFQHPLQVWCYADYKGVVCPLHRCTVTVVPHMTLSFPPRTAVLSCMLTRVLRTFGFRTTYVT